ncbi:uncharacterized protein [Palaemon carinicauda]|uniref:uncharacterized protein n=1 Tax=Palaemon carinicauda TaxID=392227 RepID=UPI0035B5C747
MFARIFVALFSVLLLFGAAMADPLPEPGPGYGHGGHGHGGHGHGGHGGYGGHGGHGHGGFGGHGGHGHGGYGYGR